MALIFIWQRHTLMILLLVLIRRRYNAAALSIRRGHSPVRDAAINKPLQPTGAAVLRTWRGWMCS